MLFIWVNLTFFYNWGQQTAGLRSEPGIYASERGGGKAPWSLL